MLTSLPAASLPAAYCTMRSVPPAIGVQFPGSLASNTTTSCKVPGAINWCSAGLALIPPPLVLACFVRPPLRRLQKSADSRYSGKDCRKALREFVPALAGEFSGATASKRESCRECRFRIVPRHILETTAEEDAAAHLSSSPRWSRCPRRWLAAQESSSCSPKCRRGRPNRNRIHLHRNLPWCR